MTRGTADISYHLLDHQLDVRPAAFVVKDPDVFQPYKGLEDLSSVGEDEGAFCLLGHTSSVKHLRHFCPREARDSPLG